MASRLSSFQSVLPNEPPTIPNGYAQTCFRVTHPFHPLNGREYVLAGQHLNWGEDRVFYHDADGEPRSMPTDWTSLAPPDPFLLVAALP
jgi:hypothetical protein